MDKESFLALNKNRQAYFIETDKDTAQSVTNGDLEEGFITGADKFYFVFDASGECLGVYNNLKLMKKDLKKFNWEILNLH
jgi:hypothetical protein